jgi:hypothetical protein
MKLKLVGIFVCILFFLLPNFVLTATTSNDIVEIDIYAGYFGHDIGFGITIKVRNNKTEQISFRLNITFDYLLKDHWDNKYSGIFNSTAKSITGLHMSTGVQGIKRISIRVETDNRSVVREGIAISTFMIFTD